ncbi:MAG: crotonase/enoyl-CoA hydratase family protein [Myxococcota bacterium]
MSEPTITVETRGHVRLIGLSRAAKRNAFTTAMLRELAAAYTAFESDPDAWVALLFADGDHFTAGLDLAEVGPAVASGQQLFGGPDGGDVVDPLDLGPRRRTKPVVCAVQGYCFTIGIELMLAADVTIAAAGTRFAQMEVRRGIMPFGGATLRFAEAAGWPRAMKWLLSGDEFDAAEALAMNLVAEVVPDGTLRERGLALAERIARRAPLAVRATLASARTARERGRDAAQAELMGLARPLFATRDAAEGVRSFIERREAEFEGR